MKLKILFGQRKQRHPGQNAPETLLCWTEYEVEENPDVFEKECNRHRTLLQSEFTAFKLIDVSVDQDKIESLLNDVPTVVGSVVE